MKKLTALLLVLVLAFAFAACGGKTEQETTIQTETTVADETTAVNATAITDETATTAETTTQEVTSALDETTAEVASTTSTETTTADAAKLPETKEEILKAYTDVVNKVKVDMPGYTNNDWQTVSNVDMGKLMYSTLNTAAKSFLETKEESEPGHHSSGSHAKWFAMPTTEAGGKVGCVLTDTSKIQSAKCVKDGDYYKITITLKEEKDPVRNMDNPTSVSSWHGKMFDVIDITQVVDYAKKLPGVNADNAYCNFVGTATLKYNPVTNECYSLDHVIDVRVFLGSGSAKVVADYHFYNFEW